MSLPRRGLKKSLLIPQEEVGQFFRKKMFFPVRKLESVSSKHTKVRKSQGKLSMSILPTPKPALHSW